MLEDCRKLWQETKRGYLSCFARLVLSGKTLSCIMRQKLGDYIAKFIVISFFLDWINIECPWKRIS